MLPQMTVLVSLTSQIFGIGDGLVCDEVSGACFGGAAFRSYLWFHLVSEGVGSS